MKISTKIIWFTGGIIAGLASIAAITLLLAPGHTERGSGRKGETEQHTILLAKARGETQPETKGDPSPNPGSGGRRD